MKKRREKFSKKKINASRTPHRRRPWLCTLFGSWSLFQNIKPKIFLEPLYPFLHNLVTPDHVISPIKFILIVEW